MHVNGLHMLSDPVEEGQRVLQVLVLGIHLSQVGRAGQPVLLKAVFDYIEEVHN